MTEAPDSGPIHSLTIGLMHQGLRNMTEIMDKAKVQAAASGPNLAELLEARLHPNMFNLLQQLQYMAYLSVEFARHLADTAPPRVGYDETRWDELRQSLNKAAAYLASVPASKISAKTSQVVPIFMDDSKGMALIDYAARVIVPDFHFHMVVAYALLRHKGITIGKSDYLGLLQTTDLAK